MSNGQAGDLARAIVHEPNQEYPDAVEIVMHWYKNNNRRRGRRRTIAVSKEQFFGLTNGAPMTGDQLIGLIERLRRQGNG